GRDQPARRTARTAGRRPPRGSDPRGGCRRHPARTHAASGQLRPPAAATAPPGARHGRSRSGRQPQHRRAASGRAGCRGLPERRRRAGLQRCRPPAQPRDRDRRCDHRRATGAGTDRPRAPPRPGVRRDGPGRAVGAVGKCGRARPGRWRTGAGHEPRRPGRARRPSAVAGADARATRRRFHRIRIALANRRHPGPRLTRMDASMSSFWMNLRYWLTDYRVLAVLAMAGAAAVAYVGIDGLLAVGGWLLVILLEAGAIAFAVVVVRRVRAQRAGARLDAMVDGQAEQAVASAARAMRADAELLRQRMAEAVRAIRSSRIGQTRGRGALYELPWYVIIGNHAAGKSTAILNSGLRFPFEDNRSNVIHGLGGTRNCDWYFTTEGIVLDTAG